MPDPGDSRRFTARQSGASDWLTLEIVEEEGDWSSFGPVGELIATAGRALARHARFAVHDEAVACIALSDDAAVRDLNTRFRGKDAATNVLSFPSPAGGADIFSDARNLGDVVVACETVAAEAREQGIAPAHHLQHLVVHGLLHLMGFDHGNDADAAEMEGLEIEILAGLGIANPYAEPAIETDDDPATAPVRRHG